MPCRGPECEPRSSEDMREIDKLTRLLCFACAQLDEADITMKRSHDLIELTTWWNVHKIADARKRKLAAAETERKQTARAKSKRLKAIRKRLMTQLDPEEREAVGL